MTIGDSCVCSVLAKSFSNMAARRMTFSDLMYDDNLTLEELTEKVLQEDDALYGKKNSKGRTRGNMFDWSSDDDTVPASSSSAFGITSSDIQDAHEFLESAKPDFSNENNSKDIVGEAWGGEKFSLKGTAQSVAVSARSGSFTGSSVRSSSFSSTDAKGKTKTDGKIKKDFHEVETTNISEIVAEKPQVSAKAYNDIKLELQKCKKTIEALKNEKWTSAPPKDTIDRIILGKPYTLEHYKSLPEKLELLDHALKYHDGNAIMAVVLFLTRTLNPIVLAKHLNIRPEALTHYIRYLEASKKWKPLLDLYKQLSRTSDALILQYNYVTKLENPKTKLLEIEKLLRDYRNAQGVTEITAAMEEERKLLDKQIKIEAEDVAAEKEGKNTLLRYHPRSASIPLKPLLTTLYYCALYHFEKPGDSFHPSTFKKEHKLTDKQYEWSLLPARAKLHRWTDISEILTASGWLKRRAERSQIGFDKVTEILHKYGAPRDVLRKYIHLIENAESRLTAATLCSCHDVSIDTIVAMRDKQKLEQYRENVKFDGTLRQRIQNILSDNSIKWK